MPEQINERDLLIRVDTKLDNLATQFTELKSSTREDVEKLEGRIDATERKLYMILGGIGVVEFVTRFIVGKP